MKKEGLGWRIAGGVLIAVGILVVLFPLYVAFINSFKTMEEAGRNFFALPSEWTLENYITLFQKDNYFIYVRNSAIITIVSVIFVSICVPAVSYPLARNFHARYYKFVYYYLVIGIFVPFQVIMLPLTVTMTKLGLANIPGVILLYIVLSLSKGVFLFVNYIRGLPLEIEDAAKIDGCSVFQLYRRIILPLTRPMLATLIIMDALWFWNDFVLPQLMLNKTPDYWTLPLFQYNFKTEYAFNYTMAFTAYLLSMLPMLIIYVCLQKHIVKGLTAGAVKS